MLVSAIQQHVFLLLFSYIPLHGYATFYPFISDWKSGCFHFRDTMNSTIITICVQVLCGHAFIFLAYIPRSGVFQILNPGLSDCELCFLPQLLKTTFPSSI